jgi:hypothetical protein
MKYQLFKLTQDPTAADVKKYLYGSKDHLLMRVFINNYSEARKEVQIDKKSNQRDQCLDHLDEMLSRCQAILLKK